MAVYVDVSSNNGTPNLQAYRNAGHTDLMLKATEGTGYAWSQMQALAREWHSFGPRYRVGYYHWLYGTLSGSTQFAWFWAQVEPVFEPGDWFMTDFEDVDPSRWVSDAQHLAVLREFDTLGLQLAPVHDYAPDWYLANLPQCRAWLKAANRPVVASDYSNAPPGNRYGLNHVAHQFTDRANVPGWASPVDYNRWLTSGESTSSSGAKEIDTVTPDDIKAIAEAAAAAVWTSDFSGHGYKAPASTVLADALRNATTAAAADPMGKSLSRSGVGPAPREVWLADARNLAAQANDNASKALAGVNELAAVVAHVLQAVQRLGDLAGVPAAPVDPKQIVAALGTAITKGVSE